MSAVSRRVRFDEGLFIAVDAAGYVGNGTVNGPKLYVREYDASHRAGPDGTVYRVRLTQHGPVIERMTGPRVSLLQTEMQGGVCEE